MTAVVASKKVGAPAPSSPAITWEVFQRKYLSREDRYKYEWVNGRVEKTLRGMDKTQLYIPRCK